MAMEEELEENREAEKSRVRVFVGGLGEGVTSEDLQKMFGSLGDVDGVDIIRTQGRSFAYVDFIPSPTDQNSLSKLFSRYNGCLWKGGKLKLEKAKEHYLVRLKREWEEDPKLSIDEPGTSPDPDESVSSKEMPNKESLKTKKLRIFFPKLRKVKSIPFLGTGKHKYSFPKVEVPPLPVHFCDCEEHSSPTGTTRPKQFHNGQAEIDGMNDEEVNIMNVVMNKLFEREKISSPMQFEKEQNSNISPGGLQSDESEVDSESDDDGLIINMETKKKKTSIIDSLELERILRNQGSELNEANILKDEPNKNKLEVQKSNTIATDKKRKPRHNIEERRNDSLSVTSEGKRHVHKHRDEMSSQVRSTELGGSLSESNEVSWSQKSSWRELLGNGGSSSFNASHMLLDSNSTEKQGSDGFYEPESPKNKTEHILMEGGQEIEPVNAEVMEELAEARPTIQNAASRESGRGVAWKQKQSWTQLVGQNNNSFSISQILPGISSQKPVAKEPSEDLAGFSVGKDIDLAKESNNESVGDGLKSVKCSLEKKQKVLAKHTTESVGDGLNMTRNTPEKSQLVTGDKIASASLNEAKCDAHTNETSTTEIKIGETCSFMRSAASLKEWAKTKAALSGSLKRKRGEKKEH